MDNQNQQQSKQDLKQAIAQSAGGEPLLGNLIYWSFTKIKIPHMKFVEIMQKAGIIPTIEATNVSLPMQERQAVVDRAISEFAPAPRFKSAVHKAINEFTKEAQPNGNKHSKFSKKLVDDSKVAAFAVIDSAVKIDGDASNVNDVDMKFDTSLKIVMDKGSQNAENLVIKGSQEASYRIKEHVKDFQGSYTTEQIRSAVLNYIYRECQGISLRENGGIYFIPVLETEKFKKLQMVFAELAKIEECAVDTIPVVNRPEAAKATWKALVADVRGMMDELNRELEDPSLGITQKKLDTRLEKIKAADDKVAMYEVLLSSVGDDLRKDLAGIKKKFYNKLTES